MYKPLLLSTWACRDKRQAALMWGVLRAAGRVSLGQAEASSTSPSSQRLAYGMTPESEHHLVAQRDIKQFQVGAAWTIPAGTAGGTHCPRCAKAGPHTAHARKPRTLRALAPGGVILGTEEKGPVFLPLPASACPSAPGSRGTRGPNFLNSVLPL